MTKQIFLNYRRDDTRLAAENLQVELERAKQTGTLAPCQIFLDDTSIMAGRRFDDTLIKEIERSDIVVVVIGPRWEEILRERAREAQDWVVEEIRLAIKLNKTIVPILVDGRTKPPVPTDVPASIRAFLKHQAQPIEPNQLEQHLDKLCRALNLWLVGFQTKLRLALLELQDRKSLYISPDIKKKHLDNIKNKAKIPNDEHVLAIVDFTLFGNATEGLAITEKMLYVRDKEGREPITFETLAGNDVHLENAYHITIGDRKLVAPAADHEAVVDVLRTMRRVVIDFFL